MKILIISQHLFPMPTPRAHRTTELVKELSRQGHEVILYAVIGKHDYTDFEKKYNVIVKKIPIYFQKYPYNSDGNSKRTLIDKVLGRLLGKIVEFPNIEFMFRGPKIIQQENEIDALITIADPHQIHWGTALARKKKYENFPPVWIADCGDPFMFNSDGKNHFAYFSKYEKLFGKYCDFITVPAEKSIKGYYPEFIPKIRVIPQGFKFVLNTERKEPNNAELTFAYAGSFYKDIRNPASFLHYIATSNLNFRFVIFTQFDDIIKPFKILFGERLVLKKPIDRHKLIEELKEMDFLINVENINSPAQRPSKLIDYAITGRPILSVNPEKLDKNTIDQFLQKNYSGQLIVDNLEQYQIEHVAKKFTDLILEKSNKLI
jgi:hypothetical protein